MAIDSREESDIFHYTKSLFRIIARATSGDQLGAKPNLWNLCRIYDHGCTRRIRRLNRIRFRARDRPGPKKDADFGSWTGFWVYKEWYKSILEATYDMLHQKFFVLLSATCVKLDFIR